MFNKKFSWAAAYGTLLTAFTVYAVLDVFIIPHEYSAVKQSASNTEIGTYSTNSTEIGTYSSVQGTQTETPPTAHRSLIDEATGKKTTTEAPETLPDAAAEVQVTADSYSDGNVSVTINEYRVNDTTVYAADVYVSSPDYLKTALAQGIFGRNVTEATSDIAAESGALLAINGDFYGAHQSGYVIRNGVLYRDTASRDAEDLVIYSDGSFGIVNENDVSAHELLEQGAVQVLSFGPALVEQGSISVTESDEVGKAMASNPRTAIGVYDDLHYAFVVSDGRTDESEGLTLYQLAEFMQSLGVSTAYNLDGGGSSTMVFNGTVINNPTTGGSRIKERSVSDIVYIG